MKRSLWLKKIACVMALGLLMVLLPFAGVQPMPAKADVNNPKASQFMALLDRAQDCESRTEGEWIYALIQPENYAVILGHTNAAAKTLQVPDRIGGADVVALADGALAGHKALESVGLPGNVNAVGSGAIPAGTLVRGYHGTYAHTYALASGYAFQNLSEFDFAEGVVDYADIRTDAFVRHSAYSVTLRELEASRLETGSVFFLIDPANAYQISYYRVVSMEETGDGFVSIRCETPVTDEVLRSFGGKDEKMMLDLSTLKLNDGVTLRAPRGATSIEDPELSLNFGFPLGQHKVTVSGKYTAGFRVPDYEGSENTEKSATMELREQLNMTVTVENTADAAELLLADRFSTAKDAAKRVNQRAAKMKSQIKTPYSYPLGVGYVFSYAGIVTVEAHFTAAFEIKGSGSVEIISETVTTYSGDTEGNSTKDSTVENRTINPKGEIEIKAGAKAEASLYLTAVCVFQISGFVGVETTAGYDALMADWQDDDDQDIDFALNALDYMRLKAYFIVEVGIRAGILKVFHYEVPLEISVKAEVKLVNIKLFDRHFHLIPNMMYVELLSHTITYSDVPKDNEHDSDECPYGKSSLDVQLSRKIGNQKTLLMEFDHLDPGFTINEPDDPTEGYAQYKLGGWYSSTRPTADTRVTFPYTIRDGANVLYANILEKQYVHFIYEDGTEIAEPQYLFPGDTIHLPATDPDRVILKWVQVESPTFLVERETVKIEPGVTELTLPYVTSDVYLCAFEAPEIEVTFYESVNGAPMYKTGSVKSKSGLVVEAPEDTEMCARFEDFGWQVLMGEAFTFPYTVPEGRIADIALVHFLGTKPAEDDFTWMSGAFGGSSYAAQSDRFKYSVYTDQYDTEYVIITGRYEKADEPSYGMAASPTRNLVIPSQIDGKPVRGIGTGAFSNNKTLEVVTLSSGLDYIGSGAFSNCTNLKMVDLTAEKYIIDIEEYAFEGCTSLTDLRVDEEAFITYGHRSFAETGVVSVYASRSVGSGAFISCPNLQRLTVPSFCKSISDSAFAFCSSLREVSIAPGVSSIGSYAFRSCSSLLELEIPDGVTCGSNIVDGSALLETLIVGAPAEETAFVAVEPVTTTNGQNSLPSLKYVEIGEGYTSVGDKAFKNMYQLEEVVFPQSMKTIGSEAFYGTSLAEVTLTGAENVKYSAFASNPRLQTVNLTAKTLGNGIFENCPALHTVVLTDTEEIGNRAFAGDVSLEDIALPATLRTIRYQAFAECESLKEIALPDGLLAIENYVFQNCVGLEELVFPDSVTQYGNTGGNGASLINGCSGLRRLYIGGGYYNQDPGHNNALYSDNAFHIGPDNHVEYLEIGEGVTAIHEPFDEYYTNVETLVLPSTLEQIGGTCCDSTFWNFGMREVIIRDNIQHIAEYSFANCGRLENVVIEGKDAYIDRYAFGGTPALKSVTMRGVRELNDCVFQSSSVEQIELGEGIQKLGKLVFDQCDSLWSIHIADTLESVYLDTLGHCPALDEMVVGGLKRVQDLVYSGEPRVLEFGAGVEMIYVKPVGSLARLERLVLPEGLLSVYEMSGIGPGVKELVLPQTLQIIQHGAFEDGFFETVEIPAAVKSIEDYAFADNPNLKRVVIHGEDVEIGSWAFANCPQLSELVIKGSIKSIGESAFYNCGLTEVILPDGLERIEKYAFRANPNCTRVVLPDTLTTVGDAILHESNNIEYLRIGGVETLRSPFSGGGEYKLACLEIGEGVKYIDSYAFEKTTYASLPYLETVIFPESLEQIGRESFDGASLRSVEIKGGNLKKIDASAFLNCAQLESVVIESDFDVTFGSGAFKNCKSLTHVQLDDGITALSSSMFMSCSALEEINLPENLLKIGSSAFEGCSLKNIDLPDGLVEIGDYAFENNTGLTSASIPDSVTTIGHRIFDRCGLTRLRIGGGIDLGSDGGSTIMAGMADNMTYIELAEGITDMPLIIFGFNQNSSDKVNTVVLPETMTTIKASMMYGLYGATHVKLGSSVDTFVPYNGSIYYDKPLEFTTLYTDTYNDVVAQIAETMGATYVSLDGMTDCLAEIRISLDGVAGAEAIDTLEGDLFSGISLPDVPAQEGYRFTGWYYDEACTVPVKDGDRFTGDMSLYAGFAPADVTVFALKLPPLAQMDGLEENALLPASYMEYAQHKQPVGGYTQLPVSPVLEGYAFTGWHADPALYLPFENAAAQRHPAILYGGFTSAGQGGMMESGENGLILTDYLPTEMDGTSVLLPETIGGTPVAGIGARAFSGLDVTEITLPAGLCDVDTEAFHGAASLQRIAVSTENTHFSTLGGVLYNKDRTVLVRYPEGRRASSFTVPATVRSIAPGAFENCTYLQSISLPDGLESIGEAAFARSGLKKIALPDSAFYLGDRAFESCRQMTSFTAYGLTHIGSDALPTSLSAAIRGPLLEGALRDAAVPEGGRNLRYNIRYLSIWNGSEEMTAYAVEAGMPLPAEAQGSTASAGHIVYALYQDAEMTLPCDLTVMPDEDVNLYAEIRPVFATQSVTLDGGETGLMITAYNGNGGAVTLPRAVDGVSVIALGEGMLASALGEVTSIDIGSGVISMAAAALHGADGLPFAGTVYADAGSYAAGWAQENGVKLSASVYTLAFNAMGGSRISSMQAACGALLRLPTPVRTGYAFSGWYLDEALTTAAALDEIGLYVFPGENTTLYAGWTQTQEGAPAFTYTEDAEGMTITGYTGDDACMRIPESINGVAVTAIGDRAFAGNTAVTAVELPATLLSIGDSAFARMAKLEAVVIPDSVQHIGYAAFRNCTALSAVHIGAGLTSLGQQAFRGAASLTGFTVSAGGSFTQAEGVLYTDGGQTLVCCPAGRTGDLSIALGTTYVQPYAIAESGISSLTLPDSMEMLGEYALYDCDSLTELVIGDGNCMLYLPEGMLSGADGLQSIHLGSRVWGIGASAFFGCGALKQAYIAPEVELIDTMAFTGVSKSLVITGRRASAAHACAQEQGFTFLSDAQDDVTSLTFEQESMTLVLGTQTALSVIAHPALPEGEALRWSSSEPQVARVVDGVAYALSRGTAVITASAVNGVKAEMTLTVKGTPAETLSVAPQTLYVSAGRQKPLTHAVTPDWADTACTWESDDESIAAVDESGMVTGLVPGETIVRARTESGCIAEAAVIVYKPVEEIRLLEGSASLTLNAIERPTAQIRAAAYPLDATFTALEYTSDNEEVLTVDENGVITIWEAGEANVIVSNSYTEGEPASLTIQVTVDPWDISGETIPDGVQLPYNGSAQTPPFELIIGGRTLVKNTDYIISNMGKYSLGEYGYTVTGTGLFTGSISGTYEIVELVTTVSYTGDTTQEYGRVSISPETNASSRLKYAYATASEPDTWITGRPSQIGEYILRFYVPDAYGVVGCELQVPFRIVDTVVKAVTASAYTIHLYTGQNVLLDVGFELVEGASSVFASLYRSEADSSYVINSSGIKTTDDGYQLYLKTSTYATGEAQVRVYRSNKTTDEVYLKVYVHPKTTPMRLPLVTQIGEEALMNTAAAVVQLEGAQVSIGERAFKDSASLWQVAVPNDAAAVAPDALEGTQAVLVCPSADSQAAAAAQAAGVPYVIVY